MCAHSLGTVRDLDVGTVEKKLEMWKEELSAITIKIPNSSPARHVIEALEKRVEKLEKNFPLLQAVSHPGFKDRHWKQIKTSTEKSQPAAVLKTMKVMELLSEKKHIQADKQILFRIEEVTSAAAREHVLETSLRTMQREWVDQKFELSSYKNTGMRIVSCPEEVEVLLETQLVKTQVMTTSPFVGSLLAEVKSWLSWLYSVQKLLYLWKKSRASWVYLEPIFSCEDIAYQVPEEARKFRHVADIFKSLNSKIVINPLISEVAKIANIQSDLESSLKNFAFIQHGFHRYLEKKRQAFPRFYFLSDDELLELLSESGNPEKVQKYINRLFGGIRALKFDRRQHIVGFCSPEGEEITLFRAVIPGAFRVFCAIFPALPCLTTVSTVGFKGHIEKWLLEFEKSIKTTVRMLLEEGMRTYVSLEEPDSVSWLLQWPCQVVHAVTALQWTKEVEDGISFCSLKDLLGRMEKRVQKLVTMLNDTGPNSLHRILLEMLTTLAVEVWDLTFRILMTALQGKYGGLLEGPAATGKTECVKELAKAVGREVKPKFHYKVLQIDNPMEVICDLNPIQP